MYSYLNENRKNKPGNMLSEQTRLKISHLGISISIETDRTTQNTIITLSKLGRILKLFGNGRSNPPSFWSKVENTEQWHSIEPKKRPKGVITELYSSASIIFQELTDYYKKPVHYTIQTKNENMILWLQKNKEIFPVYEAEINKERVVVRILYKYKGRLRKLLKL